MRKERKRSKFKVGELLRFTERYNKWVSDFADENHSVSGVLKFSSYEEIVRYGLDRFSNPNSLDIYALIEGDNGSFGHDEEYFAYRVYFFNELGYGWGYVEPKDLERL